jgi:hypothetical protein
MASEVIVDSLTKLVDRPWPEWRRGKPLTAAGLARLFKPFKIRSKQVWVNGGNVHGYDRADFGDAWSRYLPKALDPLEPAPDKDLRAISQPLGAGNSSGLKNDGNPCAPPVLASLAPQKQVVEV